MPEVKTTEDPLLQPGEVYVKFSLGGVAYVAPLNYICALRVGREQLTNKEAEKKSQEYKKNPFEVMNWAERHLPYTTMLSISQREIRPTVSELQEEWHTCKKELIKKPG